MTAFSPEVKKSRSVKKIVIIVVSVILTLALILTAILVGMYMFNKAEENLIQLSVNLNEDTTQDVTSNRDTNIIQYHIRSSNEDVWIVDDFNRDIQVLKISTAIDTNCYVVPLNRSITTIEPSNINDPSDLSVSINATQVILYYTTNGIPIQDTSFLSKTASDICGGTSVYWLYPECNSPKEMSSPASRHKRGKVSIHIGGCAFGFCVGISITFMF